MLRLAVASVVLVAPAAPGGDDRVAYAPPVRAPVVDPFRPPPRPWLPGNRGIEYATGPGTEVRAAGRGTVTFAGPVAGSRHVTAAHPDGVRTSYSYLAVVRVAVGQAVSRGTVVGVAGARLHVGARRGHHYIDPASLWSAGPPRVQLVPLDGAGPGRVGAGAVAAARSPLAVAGAAAAARAPLAVVGAGLPRLARRPGHFVPARSPPHSSVRQRSPSGVRAG
ncbi:MAG TPA: M23 family metallopeptidase [Acidimicrobiales bacterium]|nr:M23 family metallopeptidase [Acidimicrobiales bacterium]